jgi:ABC-2 type transport system ATP-binding protein
LVIIDEPFTALDPVNTRLVKDLMGELRGQGATIIMCTHQMHQVEELSDRILLINQGRDVLYGELDAIRRRYSGHAVLVRAGSDLPAVIPGVEAVTPHNSATRLTLSAGATPQGVLKALLAQDVILEKFEIAVPTLDEIFIRVVGGGA